MFEIGQIVTYATSGACRIDARETRRVAGMDLEYFILHPVYDKSMTICVPTANPTLLARMRPALDREAILDLIHTIPEHDAYSDLAPEERRERYEHALQSGDQTELARMLRSIHGVKKQRQAVGKQLSSYEENVMREAENMLHTEFAHALGIEPGQVAEFIRAELDGDAPLRQAEA